MREQFDRPRMRQLHVGFRAGQHIAAVRRVIDCCRRCNRLGNVQDCATASGGFRGPAQASCVALLRPTPRSARVERSSRIWDCKVYCGDLSWLDRAGQVGGYHASATCLPNPIRCCARPCRETSSARTWHLRITQVMPPRLRVYAFKTLSKALDFGVSLLGPPSRASGSCDQPIHRSTRPLKAPLDSPQVRFRFLLKGLLR